jgi:hypothetical protein
MRKDTAKSIKAKLLSIAGKKDINYQQLVIRYLYERLLYRLSVSRYKEKGWCEWRKLLLPVN